MGYFLAFILLMCGACLGFAICAILVMAKDKNTVSHDLVNRLQSKGISPKDTAAKMLKGEI